MLVYTSSNPLATRKLCCHEALISPHTDAAGNADSSLKQIDIEFMRRLHTKVNLIPVIAKADTLTDDEIVAFKQRVRTAVRLRGVNLIHTRLRHSTIGALRYRSPQHPNIPSPYLR